MLSGRAGRKEKAIDLLRSVEEHAPDGRLIIHDLTRAGARDSLAADVRAGLLASPKRLPPKYFYDELGSRLFDAICLLPEYYPTRAEDEILAARADEIIGQTGAPPLTLLELGSGSAAKTRRLIEAVLRRQPELTYTPVDISATALESSARVLLQSYPALRVAAYAGDYFDALAALRSEERGRTLALFLGSNVGNFDAEEARLFLRGVRGVLRAGDGLLLGADLKKEKQVLEEAYDDALGVTAAFNRNLLARLNRELDADFHPRSFAHVAVYDETAGRVEIYLESRRAQIVKLRKLALDVEFRAGERLHTENSHKYDLTDLTRMAGETGFTRARTWTDAGGLFSSNLFVASGDGGGVPITL